MPEGSHQAAREALPNHPSLLPCLCLCYCYCHCLGLAKCKFVFFSSSSVFAFWHWRIFQTPKTFPKILTTWTKWGQHTTAPHHQWRTLNCFILEAPQSSSTAQLHSNTLHWAVDDQPKLMSCIGGNRQLAATPTFVLNEHLLLTFSYKLKFEIASFVRICVETRLNQQRRYWS